MSQQATAPTFRQRWLARASWLTFLAHDLEKAVQAQRMGSLAEAGVPEVLARPLSPPKPGRSKSRQET